MDRLDIFEQIKKLDKSIDIILAQEDLSILNLVEISNRLDLFSREKIRKIFAVVCGKKYYENIDKDVDRGFKQASC